MIKYRAPSTSPRGIPLEIENQDDISNHTLKRWVL